jgi:hypothetical protein
MKKIWLMLILFISFGTFGYAEFEKNFDINATYLTKDILKVGENEIFHDSDIYDRADGLAVMRVIKGYEESDNKIIFNELKKAAVQISFFEDYQSWGRRGENVYFRTYSEKNKSSVNVFYVDNVIILFTFNDGADDKDFDQLMTYIKMNGLIDPRIQSYVNLYLLSQRYDLYIKASDRKFQDSLDSSGF